MKPLSIPEPCSENYGAMRPTKAGRHCQSCNTEVVDFRQMTTDEIQAFFSKPANAAVCGRYKASQVASSRSYDRLLAAFQAKAEKIRLRPLRLAFLGLLSGMMVFTNCLMGKRVEPYTRGYDNDQKEHKQEPKKDSTQTEKVVKPQH